jgi:hypothetical protein
MRATLMAALTAAGLWLGGASAHAHAVIVAPGSYAQYYTPYSYGSYYYPNTGYAYSYPSTSGYTYPSYVGPTVYGPGYTASYPYMYNQLNYGYSPYNYSSNYYPGYTTYRSWRYR